MGIRTVAVYSEMEHTLTAPQDGKVQDVCYGLGEQVAEGVELVVLA